MGVKKQMGNNHVSDKLNFQTNLIGCGLGAFFFPLPSFLSLSLSPLVSLPILPSFCSFFFSFFFFWSGGGD